jgi:hypothetical protein
MVMVRAAADGKPLPWLFLDTGNGARTLLATALAEKLGLRASGGVTLAGVGGTAKTRFRTADRFTVGSATIPNPVFGECPDGLAKALSDATGAEVGGLLGQEFLFQVVVEVDPGAGTVAVHNPAAYRLPTGGAWEAVRFSGRNPCIRADYDGKAAGWYSFDTAFEAPLVFNIPAVARGKMLDGVETTPHALHGVGGREFVRKGAGGTFRVFGRTARLSQALYAADSTGGHTDPYTLGAFGPSALGPGTIVLDYPNSRIGFVPKSK